MMKTMGMVLALGLVGCSTTGAVNGSIAQGSASLARQCGTVQVLINTASRYAKKPKVVKALAAAEAARSAFCMAPPTDEQTAILTLGTVILSVQAALQS